MFYGKKFIPDNQQALIVRRLLRRSRNLLHTHIGPPLFGIGTPHRRHTVAHRREVVHKVFPCRPFRNHLAHVEPQRMPGGVVQILGHVVVPVVHPSQPAISQIAERVPVRGVVPLRAEPPLIPVAQVALVEANHVVVQKIGLTSASGACQFRLCNDRVPFQQRVLSVESGRKPVPHLAEEPAERPLRMAQPELHLADVTRLVHRQLCRPRGCLRAIDLRHRVGIHSFRRPCHGTI